MAWSTVPVTARTDKILATAFDEVRLAILEKAAVAGLTLTVTDVSTNGDQLEAVLTNYQSNIETLLVKFANPSSDYSAYTKSTCLTAALGTADWTTVGTPKYMKIAHINELRSVLNQLLWVRILTNALTDEYQTKYASENDGDKDTAWSDAKTTYNALSWSDTGTPIDLGFFTTYSYSSGYTYRIYARQAKKLEFAVIAGTVLDTKMRVDIENGSASLELEVGTPTVDLYEQADFGGTPLNFGTSGYINREVLAVDVATVSGGTTATYSLRTNPVAPDLDNNRASDATSSTGRGLDVGKVLVLLVKYDYSYGA